MASTPARKKPAPARAVAVEVVTDNNAMDLATIQQGIAAEQEQIDQHVAAAKEAALPHMLQIGLYCLQAQQLLAISDPAKRNQTGKNQHSKEALSEADKASETSETPSFKAWLASEVREVSRPNAYNYLRAVQGLGLDHTATPKDLSKALQKARKEAGEKKLSIAKLAHAGPKLTTSSEDDDQADPNSPEAKAGEARVFVAGWTARWDLGVKAAHLEDLDLPGLLGLEEFLRNATDHVKLRIKSAKSAKPGKAA